MILSFLIINKYRFLLSIFNHYLKNYKFLVYLLQKVILKYVKSPFERKYFLDLFSEYNFVFRWADLFISFSLIWISLYKMIYLFIPIKGSIRNFGTLNLAVQRGTDGHLRWKDKKQAEMLSGLILKQTNKFNDLLSRNAGRGLMYC